jgi:hypothetical protein
MMADKVCEDACIAAYQSTVIQINRTLLDGLSLAKSDAEREACKARFEKGMALAKEVKELCLATCG